MTERYPIPAAEARIEIRVMNSRFIASAAHAATVEAARAWIDQVRAAMPDASHHVYAYLIGYGGTVIAGMSDAGEPSGTAGPTIAGGAARQRPRRWSWWSSPAISVEHCLALAG